MNCHLFESQTPAVEDYLRAIYQLTERDEGQRMATTSELAACLDVRPASVTAMLQRVAAAQPALVHYHKSHGVTLTADGIKVALGVVRNHRLLESYLHAKLGFGWDEVHEEADRLEHVVSPEMAQRMAEALGNPTHDPHGHAIPAADLSFDSPATISLLDLAAGQAAQVHHVRDDDSAFLRYLDTIGLRPGSSIIVSCADESSPLIWLQVDDCAPIPVDQAAAERVFIIPKPTLSH